MTETILRRTALTSATLMLFGVMSDRTTWVRLGGRGQSMTDGAVCNSIASLSGIVALIALAVALNTRPRLFLTLPSLLVAVAAFGLSIFVSGIGVWALVQGEILVYSAGVYAEDLGPKWVVYPAVGPYLFATLSAVGAIAVSGLGMVWLRDAHRSRHALRAPAFHMTGVHD